MARNRELSSQELPRRPRDYEDGEPLAPPPDFMLTAPERRQRRNTPIVHVPPLLAPSDHRCGINRTDLVVFAVVSACVNAIVSVVAFEVLHAILYRR
ncbi:MAG: hypothetical protein ACREQD_10310 [Candidatus Binataceae bacterium]